jgi:DNA gyrase subunit A
MVVTVTMTGYIKRTPLALFREQKRGGKGRSGMSTKDEDCVTELFVTSTHNPVLFFSNLGRVYRMKVWRLPEGGRPPRAGRWSICCRWRRRDDLDRAALPQDERMGRPAHHVRDRHGTVRRNSMDAFTNIPTAGKIAMSFGTSDEGEEGEEDSLDRIDRRRAADRGGRRPARHAQRQGDPLHVDRRPRVPVAHSTGVRGVRLLEDDQVISMSILRRVGTTQEEREAYLQCPPGASEGRECTLPPSATPTGEGEQFILTITENGYGKRSRPMSIAAPTAAARASPTSSRRSATAASSPASRSSRASS